MTSNRYLSADENVAAADAVYKTVGNIPAATHRTADAMDRDCDQRYSRDLNDAVQF